MLTSINMRAPRCPYFQSKSTMNCRPFVRETIGELITDTLVSPVCISRKSLLRFLRIPWRTSFLLLRGILFRVQRNYDHSAPNFASRRVRHFFPTSFTFEDVPDQFDRTNLFNRGKNNTSYEIYWVVRKAISFS